MMTYPPFDEEELVEIIFVQNAVIERLRSLIDHYEKFIDDEEEIERIKLECVNQSCGTARQTDS